MAFVRVKKIKTKNGNVFSYAYRVESKYSKRKKAGRQKIVGYLERVFTFPKKNDTTLGSLGIEEVEQYLSQNDYGAIVKDMVGRELMNHGFRIDGNCYSQAGNEVCFDGSAIRFGKMGMTKKVVFQMNEGFLCKQTYCTLINFEGSGDDREVGLQFSHAVLEAGLKMPAEIFVGLFNRFVMKDG
jgi:hypothetical protein